MRFDFDQPIDRRNTHSSKWDMMEKNYGVSNAVGIPMWVADMDFLPPKAVNDALTNAVAHGVQGYFGDEREHKSAIINWMHSRHGWKPESDWITTVHGIVAGVALCLQAFTKPGDGVILFTPVYHAFARIIKANQRRVVECPMPVVAGRFEMDLTALAQQLTGTERVIILCSPHNPGGRVWTSDELHSLAQFAAAHDLLILSDEIHCDLILPGNKHRMMPLAAPDHMDRIVMLTAATKTFNIAGSLTGNVIIADPDRRAKFTAACVAAGVHANRLAVLMATAAYQEGAAWLVALMVYLEGNRKLLDAGLNAIPGIRLMPMQATFLAWIDLNGTGISDAEIIERFHSRAKVVVMTGPQFGLGGSGFIRLNFGTQRHLLKEAIARIQSAFADLQ